MPLTSQTGPRKAPKPGHRGAVSPKSCTLEPFSVDHQRKELAAEGVVPMKLSSLGPINTKSRRNEAGGKNVGVKPVHFPQIPRAMTLARSLFPIMDWAAWLSVFVRL